MSEVKKIPTQRPYLGLEELHAVGQVFESRWLGLGSQTQEFEQKLRILLGATGVVAVNSGTSAIHLALEALVDNKHLKPGDEVIVPSLTFAATIQPIIQAGLCPVFCDVYHDSLNMNPNSVAQQITDRTRAIMPVHFGGEACDLTEIIAIASVYNLSVIEDAAHAFGSTYNGEFIGNHGDVVCFSFDPIKNITCLEGGAITTKDGDILAKMSTMRILGISKDTWARYQNKRLWDYDVSSRGYRYHMPNVNAAVGLEQLKRFDKFRQRKREIVSLYDKELQHLDGVVTLKHDLENTFPFFYVARFPGGVRDNLAIFLKEKGIETGIHYIPNHLHPFFSELKRNGLPETEQAFKEILTLPLYYEMTDEQVSYVIDSVKKFLAK